MGAIEYIRCNPISLNRPELGTCKKNVSLEYPLWFLYCYFNLGWVIGFFLFVLNVRFPVVKSRTVHFVMVDLRMSGYLNLQWQLSQNIICLFYFVIFEAIFVITGWLNIKPEMLCGFSFYKKQCIGQILSKSGSWCIPYMIPIWFQLVYFVISRCFVIAFRVLLLFE